MLCCVGNHKKMLLATGYKADNIKEYRYFDNATKSLDLNGMQDDLEVTIFIVMAADVMMAATLFLCFKTIMSAVQCTRIVVLVLIIHITIFTTQYV